MTATDVHISLAHEAPSADYLAASASHSAGESFLTQPSLVLAGHYCGGVWRLPLLGAFYIPSSTADRHGWFPAQEDVQGLSSVSGTQVYLSLIHISHPTCSSEVPIMFYFCPYSRKQPQKFFIHVLDIVMYPSGTQNKEQMTFIVKFQRNM